MCDSRGLDTPVTCASVSAARVCTVNKAAWHQPVTGMKATEEVISLPAGQYQPLPDSTFDDGINTHADTADIINLLCCSKVYQNVVAAVWLMASMQLLVACGYVYPSRAPLMTTILFGASTAAICGALASLVQLTFRGPIAGHKGALSSRVYVGALVHAMMFPCFAVVFRATWLKRWQPAMSQLCTRGRSRTSDIPS